MDGKGSDKLITTQTDATRGPVIPDQVATALDDLTVEVVNGEPRASALQLAELLGYKRPLDIKELIARHRSVLEKVGRISTIRTSRTVERSGRGSVEMTSDVPWLNRTQCILVTGKANTTNAEDAQIKIAKSFEREQDRAIAAANGAGEDRKALATLVTTVASLAATVADLAVNVKTIRESSPAEISDGIGQKVAKLRILNRFLSLALIETGVSRGREFRSARSTFDRRLRTEMMWDGCGRSWARLPAARFSEATMRLDVMEKDARARAAVRQQKTLLDIN